jgi:TrmH family RNA methyltransferase
MLSKAQNKYIRSLSQQKYRKEYNVFVVEGDKMAKEWLSSDARIETIVATESWAEEHKSLISKHKEADCYTAKEQDIQAVSGLQTNTSVLLVAQQNKADLIPGINEWCIALDGLQDPGNMGTIIRIADWFGINHIICSPNCVEAYNPKVVQSAMGGHLRVNIYEAALSDFLSSVNMPVIAAVLGGENVYEMKRLEAGVLVIGNESKGISPEIQGLATKTVTIPRKGGAESLNAGVSAGILCSLLLPL